MPKTCVQPVKRVGIGSENEQHLYSTLHRVWSGVEHNPQQHPHNAQVFTPLFSTYFFRQFHLLNAHLSTFYTGLITNTTNNIK